jgi:hypothetical protein
MYFMFGELALTSLSRCILSNLWDNFVFVIIVRTDLFYRHSDTGHRVDRIVNRCKIRLFVRFIDVGRDFPDERVSLRAHVNEPYARVATPEVAVGHWNGDGHGVRLRTTIRKGYGTGSRLTTDVIMSQSAVLWFFQSSTATVMRETSTG